MSELLLNFASTLISVLSFAIFGRVLMSWFSPTGTDPISVILMQITEPVLAPIRRVMPRLGMFDLTPMVALLLLNMVIRPLLVQLL